MLEKPKQFFKKLFELIKKYYIFIACTIFILIGLDFINSGGRSYNGSEAEIIGYRLEIGLKIIAGSILIGTSLLSLAIVKKNNSK
jgi:hypothetical protein